MSIPGDEDAVSRDWLVVNVCFPLEVVVKLSRTLLRGRLQTGRLGGRLRIRALLRGPQRRQCRLAQHGRRTQPAGDDHECDARKQADEPQFHLRQGIEAEGKTRQSPADQAGCALAALRE